MKIGELFRKAIKIGMDNDPRGKDAVLKELEGRRKDYGEMKDSEKEFFDLETLENPYADSRVLFGREDAEANCALVGIDIEVGEILLADALRGKGEPVDLLIAHHPEGRSYAKLYEVMRMQADILGRFGVSISAAESLMEQRITDVQRRIMPVNHTRAVDAARLLGIPMLNLHTPADNMVASHLQGLFDEKQPHTLGDAVDLLRGIPEYRHACGHGAGPEIILGSKKRKAGKVFVDMTGGTEGSKDIFASVSQSGINTIVGMHFSDDHRKEAEKHHLNMVVAGHISSDNLGINLLLDEISRGDSLRFIECSGFHRVSRL